MKIDLNQNMTARSTKVGLSTLATPSDSAPPVMTLDQLHFCSVGWRSNILKQSTISVIFRCSSISCIGGRHRPTYSLIETGDLPLPLSYSIQWEWFVWLPWSLQSVWSSWPGWPGQPGWAQQVGPGCLIGLLRLFRSLFTDCRYFARVPSVMPNVWH